MDKTYNIITDLTNHRIVLSAVNPSWGAKPSEGPFTPAQEALIEELEPLVNELATLRELEDKAQAELYLARKRVWKQRELITLSARDPLWSKALSEGGRLALDTFRKVEYEANSANAEREAVLGGLALLEGDDAQLAQEQGVKPATIKRRRSKLNKELEELEARLDHLDSEWARLKSLDWSEELKRHQEQEEAYRAERKSAQIEHLRAQLAQLEAEG